MTKPILITGANGFVGTHLAIALAREGFRVRASDVIEDRGRFAGEPNIEFVRGDITDADDCARLTADVAGLVHAGGISRVSTAVKDPARCVAVNVNGTANLLRALRASRSPAWIVTVSTREVDRIERVAPADCAPQDVYALSKMMAEDLARAHAEAAQCGLMICRLSDVYGSNYDHPDKLLPTLLTRALQHQPLQLNAPHSRFNFTHIDDVVATLTDSVRRLNAQPRYRALRRVWSGNAITALELAQLILQRTQSRSSLNVAAATPAANENSETKSAQEEKEPSHWTFAPTVDIAQGISRLVAGYRCGDGGSTDTALNSSVLLR
jgi:nucleoside-diphosphate-sugar epimerase